MKNVEKNALIVTETIELTVYMFTKDKKYFIFGISENIKYNENRK